MKRIWSAGILARQSYESNILESNKRAAKSCGQECPRSDREARTYQF
jgi:hypothetical protein